MNRTVRHVNLGTLRKQLAALPAELDDLPVFVAAGKTVEPCAGFESNILDVSGSREQCVVIVPTPPWDYQ